MDIRLISLLLSIAAVVMNAYVFIRFTLPNERAEHRARQASRMEYEGWTLPWFVCGLWWFGLENMAPKFLRRTKGRRA